MYIKGNRKCFNMSDKSGIAVGKQKLDRTYDFDKCYIIDFTHFCSLFGIHELLKTMSKLSTIVLGVVHKLRLQEKGGR